MPLIRRGPLIKKRTAHKEYSLEVVSPSLLAQIHPNKKTSKEFSLGMCEWTSDYAQGENEKENSVSSRSTITSNDDDFKQPTAKKARAP